MTRTTVAWVAVSVASTLAGGCASTDANKARPEVMDLGESSPAARVPQGPAPAEPSVPAEFAPPAVAEAPAASGPRKHVVAAKDTLYALATKYYGDSKQWPRIVKANPGLVPERMPVGKTIVIP